MIDPDARLKAADDVILTELEDSEAVVLNLQTKMYYTLNSTGVRIWHLMCDGLTLRQVSEHIQNEFDVTAEKAEGSTLRLINELCAERLVEIIDG